MNANSTTKRTEFTPQIDDLKAMAQQDAEVLRERVAEGNAVVTSYINREPLKALGIALGIGVFLGWMIRGR